MDGKRFLSSSLRLHFIIRDLDAQADALHRAVRVHEFIVGESIARKPEAPVRLHAVSLKGVIPLLAFRHAAPARLHKLKILRVNIDAPLEETILVFDSELRSLRIVQQLRSHIENLNVEFVQPLFADKCEIIFTYL